MELWQQQLADLVAPAVERSVTTQEVVIGAGTLGLTGAVAARVTPLRRVLVMADSAGFAAAGQLALDALSEAGFGTRSMVIPGVPLPEASVAEAEPFRAALAADPGLFPIAVGSGVINDMVKWAAFQNDRRYLAVATAASMDGYASAGAPLAQDGFKVTIPARAPVAMVADLDVIATAPAEMNGWGYGDLAGKVSAGGDWLLADAMGVGPLDDVAWHLVQDHLRGWLAGPEGIAAGRTESVARLFIGLTAVGLAMELHGSSRPASGADHQIAHLWEMEGLAFDGRKVSHGAAVGVGCVASLALFDWLLGQDLTKLDTDVVVSRSPDLDARLNSLHSVIRDARVAVKAEEELRAKSIDCRTHRDRLERLRAAWPVLKSRLTTQLLCAEDMAAMLAQAGCPAYAYQIGVTPDHLLRTLRAAAYIRRRYTIFDLLHDAGLTEAAFSAVLPKLSLPATEAAE